MKETQRQAVPNSLRHFRKQRGLRQQDVAEVLDIKDASIISKWENGYCIPHIVNLVKLAVLYRTMVDAIYIDLRMTEKRQIHEKERRLKRKANINKGR